MIEFTQTYRKAQANGASKIGLVVSLYETIIADLAGAVTAIRAGNVERRSAELHHALTVLGYLQGTLNHTEGGNPAKDLDRFYSVMREKILEGHVRASASILDSVIGHITEICDAWRQVDDQMKRETVATSIDESQVTSASWTA